MGRTWFKQIFEEECALQHLWDLHINKMMQKVGKQEYYYFADDSKETVNAEMAASVENKTQSINHSSDIYHGA